MTKMISELSGLGPFMTRVLAEIDVHDEDDLRTLGAVETYARLKMMHGKTISLNALWGIDAALNNMRWQDITPARKAELKSQLAAPPK